VSMLYLDGTGTRQVKEKYRLGYIIYFEYYYSVCRSQWPRGLRGGSAAVCLLRLWVRIPPGGMDVFLL